MVCVGMLIIGPCFVLFIMLTGTCSSTIDRGHLCVSITTIRGAYKLSEYFTKLDDRCILRNEIVHTTFGSTSQEDHDVQIAVGTRVEPPQIPGHTNYTRSMRQSFPSNTGLRFSRKMSVATIGPLQMLRSLCVIDTNFTILRYFLLKLWNNEILR
jgi:hypothetical protein